MSGLYLLVVVGIWAGLTALFARVWWRWRASGDANRWSVDVLCLLVMLLWIGISFWYGGGRKIYFDEKVKELCAKDGGVKVFEAVKLPPGKFDKYGVVQIPMRKDFKPDDEYYYDWNIQYFKQGNPELWRSHFILYRANDRKILGEAIGYSRRGGDLPGPWHASSFGCPSDADISVVKQRVFQTAFGEQGK
jgi:hypothetical protein